MSLPINLGLQIDGCYRRSVPNETGLCANKVYIFKAVQFKQYNMFYPINKNHISCLSKSSSSV